MQWIVNKLLDKIKKYNPELNEAQLKTRKYGLEAMLSDLSKFLIYLVIFSIFNLTGYFLISSLVYTTIRAVTGGYHAKNYWQCLVLSFLLFAAVIDIGRNIPMDFVARVIVLAASLCLNLIFAPVEHPNKPVKDSSKRTKYKIISSILIGIWCIICLMLPDRWANTVAASIALAAIMQPVGKVLNPAKKIYRTGEKHEKTYSRSY